MKNGYKSNHGLSGCDLLIMVSNVQCFWLVNELITIRYQSLLLDIPVWGEFINNIGTIWLNKVTLIDFTNPWSISRLAEQGLKPNPGRIGTYTLPLVSPMVVDAGCANQPTNEPLWFCSTTTSATLAWSISFLSAAICISKDCFNLSS